MPDQERHDSFVQGEEKLDTLKGNSAFHAKYHFYKLFS